MIRVLRTARPYWQLTLFIGILTPILCLGHDWPVHMRIKRTNHHLPGGICEGEQCVEDYGILKLLER